METIKSQVLWRIYWLVFNMLDVSVFRFHFIDCCVFSILKQIVIRNFWEHGDVVWLFVLCYYSSCRSNYGRCTTVVHTKFSIRFSLNIISIHINIYWRIWFLVLQVNCSHGGCCRDSVVVSDSHWQG